MRGIHADSVFVGHYSPRMNSIKLLLWLTPFPSSLLKPPPLLLPLFIQPFTKNSLQQVDNRPFKTKAWTVNGTGAEYVGSIFRRPNMLQNPELLLTLVFVLMASNTR